ncbi:MAG: hypothetical protein PVI30_10985 [Myxococcales bacterium]
MVARAPALQIVALLVACASPVWGQQAPSGDGASAELIRALRAIVDADPLRLARVCDRVGDGALLAALSPGTPTDARLQAVRATPWLREPHAALPPLLTLMGGRDPVLAPAAARSVLRIARRLDARGLRAMEVDPDALSPVAADLRALSERAHVRPDLRLMAVEAEAELVGVGAAPEPGGDGDG